MNTNFASDFAKINQNPLWLSPFLPIHHAFSETFVGGDLCDWLNTYFKNNHIVISTNDNQPLTFTQQNELPHGTAYEAFIAKTGKIPTRNNLHDWFGACIWATFPKSKAVLNHHHLQHISQDGKRNRVRDAITVFDENGAILVTCREEIGAALCRFDWQNSLVAPRAQWHNPSQPNPEDKAQVLIFGHALLEQLIQPRKSLCAHTLVLCVEPEFFTKSLTDKLAVVDALLAARLDAWLSQTHTTPRDLQPLPILGVPYFWQNADASFYDDTSVFRSGRRQRPTL